MSAKSPQIGFRKTGSALRESRSECCRFSRVARMTAYPCEQRQPSEQDEGIQFHCLRFRKRPNSAVAIYPRLLQGRNLRVVFNERNARRKIVEMPAEAAIVEIDQGGLISAGEQVRQSHIRMDQPVARGGLAECAETPFNLVLRPCHKFRRACGYVRRILPSSPFRISTENGVAIPRRPREMRRPLPRQSMPMEAPRRFAEPFEDFVQGLFLVRIASFNEFEHCEVSRFGGRAVSRNLDQASVSSGNRLGRDDRPGSPQRFRPGQFAADCIQ